MGSPEQARKDRLLPWIAAERCFRAIVLVTVGIVLLTNLDTDWSAKISSFAHTLGLNPNSNWIQRILHDAARVNARTGLLIGLVAIAYGVLEGIEAYGLWRRRRWGEWLTVIATSLLLIPEIWELTKSTTVFKVGALIVNIAIVGYLLWRLDRLPLVRWHTADA